MSAFRVLVVDNRDSFVHTLAGYLGELGAHVDLVEADEIAPDAADAALDGRDAVLVSPGPGDPEHAGASIRVVRAAAARGTPLLGVCLGHQAIAAAFGATVAHAPELMHGLTSDVHHDGNGVFAGLPSPFAATRYHSLAVVPETLPTDLAITATTASGVVMAIAHRDLPLEGVQFHPESVLTDGGHRLLGNWLARAGLAGADVRGAALSPSRPSERSRS
ncbi:anthranilate synthase component II [Microbacterium sp. NPDC091313]